jgi:hypothetical protein
LQEPVSAAVAQQVCLQHVLQAQQDSHLTRARWLAWGAPLTSMKLSSPEPIDIFPDEVTVVPET